MLPAANGYLTGYLTSAYAANEQVADGVRRGAEHGGGGPFFLLPLLFLLLIGFLFFRIMRRGRHNAFAMGQGRALGVLSERFAKGEISRDEYEYRRAVLNNDDEVPPAPPFASPPPTESPADNPAADNPVTDNPGSTEQ